MGDDSYDALIIGARVAGAPLAILLGDAGYRVLLVDRAAFPSPTLSTHFFRGARGVSVLKQLGVLDAVLALGCPPLTCQYNYLDGAPEPVVNPPQEPGAIGYCLSVRRDPLDALLIGRARACASVAVWEETRATALVWEGERVAGATLATPAGEQTVRARIVVGADGRHSFVAGAVAAAVVESEPPHRAIYYCYVRGFSGPGGTEGEGPEFSRLGDEVAYVFPSDAGLTCVALSVNLPTYRWVRQEPRARFCARIMAHGGLAARFAAATWEGRLLACGPERNYVRVPVGPGWALVGDAGMHQDPWSGLGIDKATVQARLLATALGRWFGGEALEGEVLAWYHAQRDADGLASYRFTVERSKDFRQAAQS